MTVLLKFISQACHFHWAPYSYFRAPAVLQGYPINNLIECKTCCYSIRVGHSSDYALLSDGGSNTEIIQDPHTRNVHVSKGSCCCKKESSKSTQFKQIKEPMNWLMYFCDKLVANPPVVQSILITVFKNIFFLPLTLSLSLVFNFAGLFLNHIYPVATQIGNKIWRPFIIQI